MAKERLWITTPYLVPHMDLMTVLQLAAMRGVEVRLLVPGEWDHYLPWYASRAYFQDLQRAGIEIWEYQEGFMHQKVMLIDDDIASVGSVNLDIRSVLLNFEQTALVEDPAFAAEVERMLEADFARSSLVEPESSARHIRWLAPVARLFGPLL
jgi:cardiolipin synthase